MALHKLKVDPVFFEEIFQKTKTFETREKDRDYQMGDLLILKEFDSSVNSYTGRVLGRKIGFVLDDPSYCLPGMVTFALIHLTVEEIDRLNGFGSDLESTARDGISTNQESSRL